MSASHAGLQSRTLLAAIISCGCAAGPQAETLDTGIGKLEFTHAFIDGHPTDATFENG